VSNATLQPPKPKLVLLDNSDRQGDRSSLPDVIEFKFQPTDFTMDIGSAWAASTGMNRALPIIQFSHGEQQGFAFTMRLFGEHNDDDVQAQFDLIKSTCLKDEDLRRPPRWQFVWGQFVDETVVVKTVGGIKVDDLRPDGTLRGATFSIQLLVYRSVDVALVAEDRPSDTFYSVTKRGDTWEDIALREYDEPAYGDVLRQSNAGLPFPGQTPGKIVKLPKLENIRTVIIEPTSIPLARTAAGLALRRDMYAKRSVSRQSAILKK
jgi:hypothetical protein